MIDIQYIDIENLKFPLTLPVVPVMDLVIFPHTIKPLFAGRNKSVLAIEHAVKADKLIFLTAQKNCRIENPVRRDIYSIGTVGLILRTLRVKDGDKLKFLIQGICKAELRRIIKRKPFYTAVIEQIPEDNGNHGTAETESLISEVGGKLHSAIHRGMKFPKDVVDFIESTTDSVKMAYLLAANLSLKVESAQRILEMQDSIQRLECISSILDAEIERKGK